MCSTDAAQLALEQLIKDSVPIFLTGSARGHEGSQRSFGVHRVAFSSSRLAITRTDGDVHHLSGPARQHVNRMVETILSLKINSSHCDGSLCYISDEYGQDTD